MHVNPLLNSKSIEELHNLLKNNLISENKIENSYLDEIPQLIKTLSEREMQKSSSGLKTLRIQKQAAEAIFFCFQIATGQNEHLQELPAAGIEYLNELRRSNDDLGMESQYENLRHQFNEAFHEHLRKNTPLDDNTLRAHKYCLILAKILKLDLRETEGSALVLLPPISVGLEEKIAYNQAALVLNGQIEKKALEDYMHDIKELSTPESLLHNVKINQDLQKNVKGYQSIIELDYPNLSEQEINYYRKIVDYHAKLLGVSLTQDHLEQQNPYPVFGIDKEMAITKEYAPKNYNPDSVERQFYKKLLSVDLLTQYMKLSTISRNLDLNLSTYDHLNVAESTTLKNTLVQKNEIEKMLSNVIFKNVPSIESLTRTRATLFAQNDDHHFLSLSHDQLIGQSPWVFTSEKDVRQHFERVKDKAEKLKFAALVASHEPNYDKLLKGKNSNERLEIQEILQRYQGKTEQLKEEAFQWQTYKTKIEFIFTQDNIGNTLGKLDDFFNRGNHVEFD